jgi:hypothetical protein
LEESRILEGTVISPTGHGISGARIVALPEYADEEVWTTQIPEATTDIDGVFDLSLPAATEYVQLTVFPPGFAITQQRLKWAESEPAIIPVDSENGTVVVAFEDPPLAWSDGSGFPRRLVTLRKPYAIASPYLSIWSRAHGQESIDDLWILPMIEPGAVRACFGGAAIRFLSTASADLPPEIIRDHCVDGTLDAGSELLLTIPSAWVHREYEAQRQSEEEKLGRAVEGDSAVH